MTKHEFIRLLVNLPFVVRHEICQALQDSLDVDRYTDTVIDRLAVDTANDQNGLSLVVHHGGCHEP